MAEQASNPNVLIQEIEHARLVLRPEVIDFVRSMEHKLQANDHKRVWKEYGPEHVYWFLTKLEDEVDELKEAIRDGSAAEVQLECADIANFALFIHDLARTHGQFEKP